MKILAITLLSNAVLAVTSCSTAKINVKDEILMEKRCEDVCIVRALNTEAREYIGIKSIAGTNTVQVYKYLDTPNFLHEAIWEASDVIKLYNSSPTNPNVATIAKYNKTAKLIEIIEKNYKDPKKSISLSFTCN